MRDMPPQKRFAITRARLHVSFVCLVFVLEKNVKQQKKDLLIPAAAGSSPSMQPLVFWPRAGAFGARAILELCAQLVWCELYDMRNILKQRASLLHARDFVCRLCARYLF